MGQGLVPDFLNDRSRLAIKVSSRELGLGGLLRRRFAIPLHCAAVALLPGGETQHLLEGREIGGDFDLVLAKLGAHDLNFRLADLPTADGEAIEARASFSVELAATRPDCFHDFLRACFTFPGSYGTGDLEAHLAPEVRRILSGSAAAESLARLHRCDAAGLVGGVLQDAVERTLFDAGVRFVRLLGLSFVSEDLERRRREERRSAAGAARRERRVNRLAGLLRDGQVRAALDGVPDPRLRGLLYARLMEDDSVRVRAEDLLDKARDCGEEVVQSVYRALEGLLSRGAAVDPDEIPSMRGTKVYAAAGSKVFEIDSLGDAPPRVLPFPEPLRSVRVQEDPAGPWLLGGTKRGAVLVPAGRPGEARSFQLPARDVRGGVNSVARDGRWIWASHSEHGLARWDAEHPGSPAEFPHADLTRGRKTTRGVQVSDGRLLFATGPHVYAALPGSEPLKYVSSVESPVSCLAAAARTIFAGTENGTIVCWKADAPDQPVVLARRREPIVTLGLARLAGIPHLVYGSRDSSLRARVLGQSLETAYEADGSAVGVVDASIELLCAADADGRRVHLWKASEPSRPARSIDLWREAGKPVLDLCILKTPARPA